MRTAQRISGFFGQKGLDYWRASCDSLELKNILPNLPAALAEYAELIEKGGKWASEEDETISGSRKLLEPLTDEEKSRARFARSWKVPPRYKRFGERWGRGISLAMALIPLREKAKVVSFLKTVSFYQVKTSSALFNLMRGVSALAKKHGDLLFPGWWKFLVNWEALGGYASPLELSAFEKDLRAWAEGDIVHEIVDEYGRMSENCFLDELEKGMRDLLFNLPGLGNANKRARTIEEFSREPGLWARTGSSHVKEAVMYLDKSGQIKKAKKTKWRTALALAPARVRDILRTQDPGRLKQRNSAIQKLETGKVRAVVSSDDETYLRMAYISDWLETALAGNAASTLFMSTEQQLGMWQCFASDTETDYVKLPLDQSHFDWMQNKRMINRFLNVVGDVIRTYAEPRAKSDLLHVLESLRWTLVKLEGDLTLGEGSHKIRMLVQKGVMSGWRWTALMDTAFNLGEMRAAQVHLRRQGFPDGVVSVTAQGDDDRILVNSYGLGAALALAYNEMGFEVNPGKFFIDTKRDEYLRQVAEPGLVSGYPIRAINAVLWRNPINRDPPAGLYRLSEQVKSWNLFIGRGMDRSTTEELMIRDLANANGLSAEIVKRILATPAPLGGLGFYDIGVEPWLQFTPGKKTVKTRILGTTVKGLDEEIGLWKKYDRTVTSEEAAQAMVNNLDCSEAHVEVVSGQTRDRARLLPFAWKAQDTSAGIPLGAYCNSELPVTLQEHFLERAVREKDWNWISNTWLAPELRAVSDRILSHGRRRVWLDWIMNKLPWNLATVPGWNDLLPGHRFQAYCTAYWSRVVGMNVFSYTTVERAALSAEISMKESLRLERIRLGG